jgi:hypothetical protein
MSKFADRGKWAENEAQTWLDARSAAVSEFAWHRFPDSRSARNPIPAQPADFLVAFRWPGHSPMAAMLEVKETENLTRLPKDKIGQYGKLRMFAAAGFRAYVLVFRSAHNDWLVLGNDDLFSTEIAPKSFPFLGLRTFPTAAAALESIFL